MLCGSIALQWRVLVRCLGAVLILCASLVAQAPPVPCPADLPVDAIIAKQGEQQSKMKHRNKNPLPEVICVFMWCFDARRTPPPLPPTFPPAETAPGAAAADVSSSKTPADSCNRALEMALEAAHNVVVGDYYFEKKNYAAALLRYQDAVQQKPEDAAIHVRLGRVFEKLNQLPEAITHYAAAEKLATPKTWSQEAHTALARLQHPQA